MCPGTREHLENVQSIKRSGYLKDGIILLLKPQPQTAHFGRQPQGARLPKPRSRTSSRLWRPELALNTHKQTRAQLRHSAGPRATFHPPESSWELFAHSPAVLRNKQLSTRRQKSPPSPATFISSTSPKFLFCDCSWQLPSSELVPSSSSLAFPSNNFRVGVRQRPLLGSSCSCFLLMFPAWSQKKSCPPHGSQLGFPV